MMLHPPSLILLFRFQQLISLGRHFSISPSQAACRCTHIRKYALHLPVGAVPTGRTFLYPPLSRLRRQLPPKGEPSEPFKLSFGNDETFLSLPCLAPWGEVAR